MQNQLLSDIEGLLREYESGRTLPQGLYLKPELFDYEMKHVLNDTWFFARHSTELGSPGDYAVLQIGRVSVILVRGQDNIARAFLNVCAHRAAKLCNEPSGNLSRITCPYHSWTYGLDGRLLSAQFMGAEFQRDQHGLRPVLVAEDCGLIFVNLDPTARPFEQFMAPNRETLLYHGIDRARVLARRQYPVNANWKLSIENFTECYHCAPSHQTLTKVMSVDRTILVRIAPNEPAAIAASARMKPKLAEMERALDVLRASGDDIPRTYREPLSPGYESGTVSGKMLLPSMTRSGHTSGTESVAVFEVHTGYFNLYEDYAVGLSYLPISHDKTVIELTWFAKGDMPEPDARVIEEVVEVWDKTTREDAWLSENTVAGVSSPFYIPGTLSNAEVGPRDFLDWYVERMRASFTGGSKKPHVWAA